MAVIHGNFYSKTLENGVQIEIALPEPIRDGAKEPLPVLYLLHGNSDDATVWQRRTSIERYADQYGMAVVMPGVQRGSAYTDQVNGEAWYTYIAQEVPDMARRYLKISQRREDTFVAGLSMGGYGAMHWALREPQRFRAAITLSGAVGSRIPTGYSLSDIKRTSGQDRQKRENRESYAIRTEFAMTYGSVEQYLQNDDAHLIRQVKAALREGKKLPDLYMACGTEDFLYDANAQLHEQLTALGVAHTYREGPGAHNWAFWDHWIQDALAWIARLRQANGI